MDGKTNALAVLFILFGILALILAIVLSGREPVSISLTPLSCTTCCPVGYIRVCGFGSSIVGSLPIINDTTTSEIIGSNIIISNNGKTITTEGEMRFQSGTTSVGFGPPANIPSSITWTLPATDGNVGEFLQTNGAGTLAWAVGGSSTTGFADNVFNIYDDLNPSSRIFFQADAIKGVDRTFIAPDADGILPAITKSSTNLMLGETNYSTLQNNSGKNNTVIGFKCGNQITDGNRNTALGDTAMNSLQKGNDNTACGYNALRSNGTDNNTAFGSQALQSNTNGNNNLAIGAFALQNNTNGKNSTAIGAQALQLSNGGNNTAIGASCMTVNTTGAANVAVGHGTLNGNKDGNDNTAIGFNALVGNISGNGNTAVGDGCMVNNIASENTAVGFSALAANITGIENTAVGTRALPANLTGSGNTAMGYQSMFISTGNQNTAIGNSSLSAFTLTGDNNTALGAQSGVNVLAGSNNVILGQAADVDTGARNNCIVIGKGAVSDAVDNTITLGDTNIEAQIVSVATPATPATARRIQIKIGGTVYTLLADP